MEVVPATPPGMGVLTVPTIASGRALVRTPDRDHLAPMDSVAFPMQSPDSGLHLPLQEEDTLVGHLGENIPLHDISEERGPPVKLRSKLSSIARTTFHLLFPSLHGFRRKSITGMVLAVFATPAILALTLTLPVVDDAAEGLTLNQGGVELTGAEWEGANPSDVENGDGHAGTEQDAEVEDERLKTSQAGRHLHHLAVGGGLPSPMSEDRPGKDLEELDLDQEDQESHTTEDSFLYNRYLAAAQCVAGPLFCAYAMFCEWISDESPRFYADRHLDAQLVEIGGCGSSSV